MNKKKLLVRILFIILGLLSFLFILIFGFRDNILNYFVTKYQNKFNTKYQCELRIKEKKFTSINAIAFTDVSLTPESRDTLLAIKTATIELDILPLLTGKLLLSNLELSDGYLQLVKKETYSNYSEFLNSTNPDAKITATTDYADKWNSLLTKIANGIPEKMKLNQINFKINDNGNEISLQSNTLNLQNSKLETTLLVKSNQLEQKWKINGLVNPRDQTANLNISSLDTSKIILPFLDKKFNLKTSFSEVQLTVDKIEMFMGTLTIEGESIIKNLTINHPKIATRDVEINNASFKYHFIVKSNSIALDSASVATLNDITFKPYLSYSREKDTIYTLQLTIPKMKAQHFISSLPYGLFPHFKGMQVTGDFNYNLDFQFNKNKPNQLIFNTKINKENLKIIAFGETNLNKLNSDFVYQAIENGTKQRPIYVGLQNPMYTPLSSISPYLQKSVLTSEDPSFFSHRGFITEAFKQSILKNIRTKKFSRGASTISMQLVKNAFLTREKTMSRKLEEIILVYILENNRITSKERMLEVYFNIIEWGPNIYGIGEAANFYFQKKPIDLTLSECLFLATIVPKPKKFMYQFDSQGSLNPFASKHHRFLSNLMQRRGLIEAMDSISKNAPLAISGNARKFLNLKIVDSTANDSLLFIKDEVLD